jgi:hypothetical protein
MGDSNGYSNSSEQRLASTGTSTAPRLRKVGEGQRLTPTADTNEPGLCRTPVD